MAVTITKERVCRIVTRDGSGIIKGTFKLDFTGNYATLGEAVDLRPYVKEITSCEVQPIYNATNTPLGYMWVVNDTFYPRSAGANAGIVVLMLINPTAAHTHTCYAHGHDLAFIAPLGGGAAVTLHGVAPIQLEAAGGPFTDATTVQDTTVVMAANAATNGTEYGNGVAYPANIAVRLRVEGY